MSGDADNLNSNKADWAAIVAKGSLGAIPLAGSFLSEIVGTLIPNQRLDRIAKYVTDLNGRLEKIPDDLIDKLRNNEQFIDLIEESFIKASRATTEERRKYILNIVDNGISNNDADINDAKYLLGLLSELSDIEIIWLRYFHERTIGSKSKFQARHENVLTPIQLVMGSSKEERQQGALQESYKEHLERLGLIKHNIRMNKDLGVPKYDTFTNRPEVSYSEATTLGNMLLENIGLIEKQP